MTAGKKFAEQQLAKLLSFMLGRQPDQFALIPDDNGFVKIKDVLKACAEEPGWKYVRRHHLEQLPHLIKECPVEFSGNLVRAVDRRHLPNMAAASGLPRLVYTAVRQRAWPAISVNGLKPNEQGWISFRTGAEDARHTGLRIDPHPVVIEVHVGKLADHHICLKQYGRLLVAHDPIPSDCLTGPPLPREKPGKASMEPAPKKAPTPGSFPLKPAPAPGSPDRRASSSPGQPNTEGSSRLLKKKRKSRRERPPWRR